MGRPRLQIDRHTVEKTYCDEREASLEREKSIAAFELANDTQLFSVPAVVASSRYSTTWRLIPDITPLRNELSLRHRPDLAKRVGRALGTVHSRLALPAGLHKRATPPFANDIVPIHGDFGLGNVQYRPGSNEIVILDWATASWLGAAFTHADQHLDIATFLTDLYYQRPRDPRRVRHIDILAGAFLSGYAEIRDPRASELRESTHHLASLYLRGAQRGWRKALRLPSLLRLEGLLRNLDP